MTRLALSFGCWDYDRVGALATGAVRPEGIDLNILTMPPEETFFRMMRHQEFDLSECSSASFLVARDKGAACLTAIPVFMSRYFRHSCIWINTRSGISRPEDLRGKRIGTPEYQLTANVWIRGLLQHDYGVGPADVHWFTGGQETPGRHEKVPLQLPPEIKVENIGPERTLNQMLADGELDAFIGPRTPSCFVKGSPDVRRLFPDYVPVEQEYFRRTGIFPIMHLVVIRDDVLERHPWVAANLYRAFVAAKNRVYEGFNQTSALKATLPWLQAELERTRALMGEDFWPYGIEPNRKTLEALVQYAHEQGLIQRRPRIEELFARQALEEYTI